MQIALEKSIPKKPHLEPLVNLIKGNRGLILTHGDPQTVCSIINSECEWTLANTGMTCPVDVYLPKGITNLDPTQTCFLPALNIATKICRGKIEFICDSLLIPKGTIVGQSQAELLKNLRIEPIPKKVEIIGIIENGCFCNPITLLSTENRVMELLKKTVQDIGIIGEAIGYPTIVNFERALLKGYTNLLCVCMETNYSFEHGEYIIGQVLMNQLYRNGTIINKNVETKT